MVVRPILFSTPMVCALLDGRKTQTRRVLKPQPDDIYEAQVKTSVGDVLWVREAAALWGCTPFYRADDRRQHEEGWMTPPGIRWRPSIHMPRKWSRLTLVVTDFRVQRLQDISEDDALAEGVTPAADAVRKWGYPQQAKYAFADLWDGINGPGAWDANPWVAAYTFTVHQTNVDTFLADRRAAA